MPTVKRDLAEFWTTGLAKLLVGDQPCELRAWLPAHFKLAKVARDSSKLVEWKIRHTEQLTAQTARLRSEGWKCQVEQYFKVRGQSAILTGKVDLITQKKDCRPVIRDVKGGDPQDSDIAQVQIYMVAIPLAWGSPDMIFDGEVIYADHTVTITPAEAQAIRPKLFGLLRKLGSDVRPQANPSEGSCKWCDVGVADCAERWTENDAPVSTLEF